MPIWRYMGDMKITTDPIRIPVVIFNGSALVPLAHQFTLPEGALRELNSYSKASAGSGMTEPAKLVVSIPIAVDLSSFVGSDNPGTAIAIGQTMEPANIMGAAVLLLCDEKDTTADAVCRSGIAVLPERPNLPKIDIESLYRTFGGELLMVPERGRTCALNFRLRSTEKEMFERCSRRIHARKTTSLRLAFKLLIAVLGDEDSNAPFRITMKELTDRYAWQIATTSFVQGKGSAININYPKQERDDLHALAKKINTNVTTACKFAMYLLDEVTRED